MRFRRRGRKAFGSVQMLPSVAGPRCAPGQPGEGRTRSTFRTAVEPELQSLFFRLRKPGSVPTGLCPLRQVEQAFAAHATAFREVLRNKAMPTASSHRPNSANMKGAEREGADHHDDGDGKPDSNQPAR